MPVEVRVVEVTKNYGATRALNSVSLELSGGSVHTILGENGSGKSTLVKALSGVVVPDAGRVSIDGETIRKPTPRLVQHRGLETVFQEVMTAPNRSLVENVYLGHSGFWSDRTSSVEQQRMTGNLFRQLGVPDVDVGIDAGEAPLLVQQITVIARALVREPRALILDEATSALGLIERDALFDVIRQLRSKGALVVFVSHRMDEIMEISDRVTVLRNGGVVAHVDRAELSPSILLELMAPGSL